MKKNRSTYSTKHKKTSKINKSEIKKHTCKTHNLTNDKCTTNTDLKRTYSFDTFLHIILTIYSQTMVYHVSSRILAKPNVWFSLNAHQWHRITKWSIENKFSFLPGVGPLADNRETIWMYMNKGRCTHFVRHN